MKIGLLHYSMPPVIGGVERVIAAHARLFRADGHEVTLFCAGSQSEMDAEFPWIAVPGFKNTGEFQSNRDAMTAFLREQKLEILFVHNVFTMPFSPVATAACWKLSGVRVVSWVHDIAAINPYYKVPADDRIRRHCPGTRVVAVSEERAAAYTALTGFSDVTVIPNGIDATGGRLELAGGFPILFHPTRILRRKNIGLGIRVVAALKRLSLNPRLVISGAPEPFSGQLQSYRAELDAEIFSAELQSNVFFLGDETSLTDAEISELYAVSDALFFPSEHEGFGLPMLEAGLRGLPIFASDKQPLAALAEKNGLVFRPDTDATRLAFDIAGFLENSAASQVRRRVRSDFDWQHIYQKHILSLL